MLFKIQDYNLPFFLFIQTEGKQNNKRAKYTGPEEKGENRKRFKAQRRLTNKTGRRNQPANRAYTKRDANHKNTKGDRARKAGSWNEKTKARRGEFVEEKGAK